jgi:hypothetical protein
MLDAVLRRLARLGQDGHGAVAVNVGGRGAHTSVVSVSTPRGGAMDDDNGLTPEELEEHDGEPLPERTQMSVLYPGPGAMPIGEISPADIDPAPTPGPIES